MATLNKQQEKDRLMAKFFNSLPKKEKTTFIQLITKKHKLCTQIRSEPTP